MERPAAILITRMNFKYYRSLEGQPLFPLDRYYVVVICTRGMEWDLRPSDCHELYILDNIDDEQAVAAIIQNVFNERPISLIFGEGEDDVLLTAHMREKFGVAGLHPTVAERFRNKLMMKQWAARAGIPIAPYTSLKSVDDLLAFLDRHGSIVVKPLYGTASVDTHHLSSSEDVYAFAASRHQRLHEYLAEAYIGGDRYHCDALLMDGKVIFAGVGKCDDSLRAARELGPLTSLTCQRQDTPLFEQILDLNEQIITVLGLEKGCTHCEFFAPDENTLLFSEIAARAIGGMRDFYYNAYGIDLIEQWVRIEIGEQPNVTLTRNEYSGVTMFLCKVGVLRSITDMDQFNQDWIRDARALTTTPGDTISNVTDEYSVLALFPYVAPDALTLRERRDYIIKTFQFEIEPVSSIS